MVSLVLAVKLDRPAVKTRKRARGMGKSGTNNSYSMCYLLHVGLRSQLLNALGTVLQYSFFSVISRFPLKTVHPFRNFLAVLPPPTLYKVETRKKFWIHASNIVCGVRGGVGSVSIGKRPRNAKVP